MSSSRPRLNPGTVPQRAKPKAGNPFRKLISALLPKEPETPPPPEVKPAPPVRKAPPPVQVIHLAKGVGTELRRAVGAKHAPPPVQVAPPVSAEADGQEAQRTGSALPAARELKSVMRKLKAAPPPPPVKQTPPEKAARTTRHPSRRTRHRDFPVV